MNKQLKYIALIHKQPDSCFGLSFPDFPGCVSAGNTLDEAACNASEAMVGHIGVMFGDGDTIPEASNLHKIIKENDLSECCGLLAVEGWI